MLRTAYLFAVYPLVLTTLLKGRHVSATVVNPTIVESRNVTGLKVYSDENADLACIASNGEWGQNQVVDPRTKKNWESWPRDRLIVDWSAWAEGLGKAGKGSKSWSVHVSRTSKIEMSGRGDVVVDMYNQTLELTSIEMGYGLAEWKGVEIHGSRFELADVWHDLETFTIWVAHPSGIPTVYVKTGIRYCNLK